MGRRGDELANAAQAAAVVDAIGCMPEFTIPTKSRFATLPPMTLSRPVTLVPVSSDMVRTSAG